MNEKLNGRIKNALKLANEAIARYHAKRDEARADGTITNETGEMDLIEYGKQMAIAGELSELHNEIENEKLNAELFG